MIFNAQRAFEQRDLPAFETQASAAHARGETLSTIEGMMLVRLRTIIAEGATLTLKPGEMRYHPAEPSPRLAI